MKRPLLLTAYGSRLAALFIAMTAVFCGCLGSPERIGSGNVALVEIKGVILEPDDVVYALERAGKRGKIKGVVVRVDSPGGSVGASQEIFRTIKKIDAKKPVVVTMGDVAASGGYYVSVGARKIFANEGTVTGSIGVRLELMNAQDLISWMRLRPETLKSGRFKDTGSIYRELSPEERKLLEDFLAELHEQFKNDVAVSRKLDKAFVGEIADGRIFTGAKAKGMGLVDEIGGYVEAVDEVAKLAGIKGESRVVKMKKKKSWLLEALSDEAGTLVNEFKSGAFGGKYFLYKL